MGIHGLTKAIKAMSPNGIREISYSKLGSGRFGVDVYSYLYPAQYNTGAKGKGSHIRAFMDLIVTFWTAGINVVFVFDGKTYSDDKKEEIDRRMAQRNTTNTKMVTLMSKMSDQVAVEPELIEGSNIKPINLSQFKELGADMINQGLGTEEDRIELKKILKRNIVITSDDKQDLVTLFEKVGVPYLQAQGEADFLLSALYEDGLIDGVVSEDKDMLTHGIGRLISGLIDANCRRSGTVMEYRLPIILDESGLNTRQFIDFCVLCGCDYCPKISGVASGKGLQFIRKYGDMDGIIDAMKSNKIKYRPDRDLTIDEFQERYNRTYTIFSTKQEPVPDYYYGVTQYNMDMDLKSWLQQRTNYGISTLDKKISDLRDIPVPTVVPAVTRHKAKPQPKVRVSVIDEVKLTVIDEVIESTPKIKISIRKK